jgi:hypothetical protein
VWPKVTYHTHALPGSDQGCNADEEANSRKSSPATSSGAEGEDDCDEEAGKNATNTKTTSEDDPRPVAVADCVADEVGMCLVAESPFDGADNLFECRRMCGDG